MQYYAEYNYDSENAMENLDKMFSICNGFEAEAFRLLDIDDFGQESYRAEKPNFGNHENQIVNTSKQALYQNPMLGLFDKNFEMADLGAHYAKIYEKLNNITIPKEAESLFAAHKQLVKVLASKCDIGIRIKKAYDAKDKDALCALSKESSELSDDIAKHKELRQKLWFEHNKPFGYEKIDMRLSAVESLAKITHMRLEDYLSGKAEKLEEFEAERLLYNEIDRPFFIEFFYDRILRPMI